ncbi:MAG TPA: hypothetical protein VM262_01985 [Acidimicrobiales bacterium]|nr:hypothetical protein [Acidimicrobiales bacterium]
MRRLSVILAALVGASSLLAPPARAGGPQAWKGVPTLIGGTARYDKGEWIHTDFVYDDYGADTGSWGQPNVVSLAGTSGDARYPDGERYADNAADIVEVRVRAHRDDLQVRVLLQTIVDPEVVALWVQVGDAEPRVFTHRNATIDDAANTVELTLPGVATGPTVTLNVGAGLHDGDGDLLAGRPGTASFYPDDYTTGGPTDNRLFDLAFNTRSLEGRGGAWNEDVQSDALAAGDLAPFAQTIDLSMLRDARHRPAQPLEPGYYVRLVESRLGLGEGVGASFPQYRATWQPYALWIPEQYDPVVPAPLFLNLHSLSVHHNQYRGGESPTYTTFYEQMGDGLGAIVVTPLGRGPDGWYLNEGFLDTLEVWSDALRQFAIDPDRTYVGGYSMGGYGTYRLSTLMPDSFASAVSVVGPPTNGIWAYPLSTPSGPTFTYTQLESTRHVPFWITHGVADELVPVLGVQAQADRLAALGHEHRFALHPAADHLSFTIQDDWTRETGWLADHARRVTDPHDVTLRIRPASLLSANRAHFAPLLTTLLAEVGARTDGAYWVGDVRVAPGPDVTGDVRLSSDGIAHRRTGTGTVTTVGIDGPSPYRLTGVDVSHGDGPTTDTLRGSLNQVVALTVDVGRARLSDSPALEVTTDTLVTITYVRGGLVVGTATIAP